ncbi:Uncharacterised protein [uncultured archaeon]|nr:Uncharacterised protein [uncultured archaeon]
MRRSLSLLVLIFLIGAAKAQSTPCLTATVTTPTSAIAVSLLALTVSFDVIAIGYILGKLFPGTKIKDWVHKEFWEVAKTAMLIVGIYAALTFFGNLASAIAPPALISGGGGGPAGMSGLVNGACSYLSGEADYSGKALSYLLGLSEGIGLIKFTMVGAYVPIVIPQIPVVAFKTGFNMSIYWNPMLEGTATQQYQSILSDMISFVAFPVILVTEMQLSALPILFALGLAVLIPMGLLLRSFPFVRGIGGTLIGIGVGVSLIWPATLVLFNYPVTAALQTTAVAPPTDIACTGSWIICGLAGAAFAVLNVGTGGALSAVNQQAALGMASAVLSMNSIYFALNVILNYSSYMMVQMLLFIFDIAIIYSISESIANMLGGTIRLSLGGKMRLI